MHILLINCPIRLDMPPANFPTGLGIIAQILVDDGHDVEILDVNAHRYSQKEVTKIVAESCAEMIAISGMVSTYKYQYWLTRMIREQKPNVTIVAGGGCATSVTDTMMTNMPVDILGIGEGEHTMRELVRGIEDGRPLEEIDGLCFRRDGENVYSAPRALEKDLDRFPLPAYHMFPTEIYVKQPIWCFNVPSMNVISSRGCPMDCNFCYNVFGQRSYRTRSAESVINEIELLVKNYGVQFVGFVDDNLTINKRHLREVSTSLKERKIAWGCHGRVDTLDDERLDLLKEGGCKWLGFGIESGSQAILDNMNKRDTVEQARAAIETSRKHGVFPNTTFIFGYPGETIDTVRETMLFKIETQSSVLDFFATPYPGTTLYREMVEKGKITNEHSYCMELNNAYDFTINMTDWGDDELIALRKAQWEEVRIGRAFYAVKDNYEQLSPSRIEGLMQLAEKTLDRQNLILPELKGIVLDGLAVCFEKLGNQSMANDARRAATQFH